MMRIESQSLDFGAVVNRAVKGRPSWVTVYSYVTPGLSWVTSIECLKFELAFSHEPFSRPGTLWSSSLAVYSSSGWYSGLEVNVRACGLPWGFFPSVATGVMVRVPEVSSSEIQLIIIESPAGRCR